MNRKVQRDSYMLQAARAQTRRHTNTPAHTHTHMHIYIYMCVCVYIYIYIIVCVFIYTYIHTHAYRDSTFKSSRVVWRLEHEVNSEPSQVALNENSLKLCVIGKAKSNKPYVVRKPL